MLGPGVFDRPRRLFWRLGTSGDGQSFVVEDATRFASKELVHRDANPARIIYFQSKGFVERILYYI